MPSKVPQSYSAMMQSCATVDQTAGEIPRVCRLERGVGQALARAVGRNEVLQNRQASRKFVVIGSR